MRFPPPERLIHRLEDDLAAVERIIPALAQLSSWAANHHPDDGLASSTGGTRSSDPTSTTERAALNGPDAATLDLEAAIEHALAGYQQLLAANNRISRYITPKAAPTKNRIDTADICPGCDKPSKQLKAGFCVETCHRQWCREGRPDRAWFIRRRKAERDAEAKAEAEARKGSVANPGRRAG